jgi:hypothetical protein
MAEINAGRVNCTKNARGAHHGSRDYSCHQEAATKKQADLQSKYARNLAQITISKRHKDIWDVSDPSFVIPTHIESQWLIIEQKGNRRDCIYCRIGKAYPLPVLCMATKFYQLCLHSRSHKLEQAKSLIDLQWCFTCHKNWQAVQGPVPLWTRWCYISRLHLMKCSPSVTLLLLPSRNFSCHRWHC